MSRMARALVAAAATVLAGLAGGCVHSTRLEAAWYLTPDSREAPVSIWLVNLGRAHASVVSVHLNSTDGFPLAPADGKFPADLGPGGTLILPGGEKPCSCGATAAADADAPPPPPPLPMRGCLPIRLFVQTRFDQKRLQRVEIEHPLPSAYAPEALLACP